MQTPSKRTLGFRNRIGRDATKHAPSILISCAVAFAVALATSLTAIAVFLPLISADLKSSREEIANLKLENQKLSSEVKEVKDIVQTILQKLPVVGIGGSDG